VSEDGYSLVTIARDGWPRRWGIPKIPADASQLVSWSELLTGLTIGPQGSVTPLESKNWLERRDKLSAVTPQRGQARGAKALWAAIGEAAGSGASEVSSWVRGLWASDGVWIAVLVGLLCLLLTAVARRFSRRNREPKQIVSSRRIRLPKRALAYGFLAAALGTSYVEWSAYTQASRALLRVEAIMQGGETPTRALIEGYLGHASDGPGREANGVFRVDYRWQGVLYTHVLHLEYSLQPKTNPNMLSYSSEKIPRFVPDALGLAGEAP
jgi:hypothetical protein